MEILFNKNKKKDKWEQIRKIAIDTSTVITTACVIFIAYKIRKY